MSDLPPSADDARAALLSAILTQAQVAPNATTLLRLAEAYAWIVQPGQSHGGGERL